MSIENELSGLENRDDSNFFLRVLKYFCPWKGDTLSDLIRKIIFIASVVIFCISLGELIDFYNASDEELQTLAKIQEFEPEANTEDTTAAAVPNEDIITPEEMLPKWYELYSLNQDVIGWVKIDTFRAKKNDPKTCFINYPVVQVDDNKEYLHKDIYGNTLESGTLFADYFVPITPFHRPDVITIYGHNMRSVGTMFTHLGEYKRGVKFLKKNPIIDFDTLYTNGDRYIIIGAYIANYKASQDDGDVFYYWRFTDFDDDKYTFEKFKEGIDKRTWYSNEIDCKEDDEYLTLSTCSNEVDDLRWVITARKIRDDEDEEDIEKMVNSYKKREDKDIYLPKCWTDVWGQVTMYKGWDY